MNQIEIKGTVTISIEDFDKMRQEIIDAKTEVATAKSSGAGFDVFLERQKQTRLEMQVAYVKILFKDRDNYPKKEMFDEIKSDIGLQLYYLTHFTEVIAQASLIIIPTKAEWDAVVDEIDLERAETEKRVNEIGGN